MNMHVGTSPTSQPYIQRLDLLTYRLNASQILPVSQKKAFSFFEDPRNLSDITPVWLDFCMLNKENKTGVCENSEFEYTIRLLGMKMLWRSRIIDYKPPNRFTDIQLKGPYKSWIHVHTLEEVPEGTLMRDEVTYRLHIPAFPLHSLLIRKKLIEIFTYRAVRIADWADKQK
jgi:ligand-binding SRPBCC domain-containing protein